MGAKGKSILLKNFEDTGDIRGENFKGYEIAGPPEKEDYDILAYDCTRTTPGEKSPGGTYTIKMIKDFSIEEFPAFTERFMKNIIICTKIIHPSIVRVLGGGYSDELKAHYLIMERLEGARLSEVLGKEGPISPGRAVLWALELLDGIGFLHRKMLPHSRINPRAIFITNAGHVKILYYINNWNLYLEKLFACNGLRAFTVDEVEYYLHRYRSPESFDQMCLPEAGSDLYVIGTVLYEMLAGKPIFEGEHLRITERHQHEKPVPPSEINPKVPEPLDMYVLRLLEKNPGERYETTKEATEALREAVRAAGINIESNDETGDS